MTPHASPTDDTSTHHVTLRDRDGKTLGLMLCDANGNISPNFTINPVTRTALKTTTGNSSYDSMDLPYSPIVQDDWQGGRGNLDFERDSTKFYDSNRCRTSRPNKAFHGPQEQYTKGYRSQDYLVPGNVIFHKLLDKERRVAKRFQASAGYTIGLDWLLIRRRGTPADLTIRFYSDNAGQINASLSSITVPATRLPDVLSEWIAETASQALVSGTWYWVIVDADPADTEENCWHVAVKASSGTSYYSESGTIGTWSNWTAASYDLYFRTTDADTEKRCIYYTYKSQQYKVISGVSGAPQLYINGDRGAADSNAGTLDKLKDATKTWTANQWAGCVALITDGPGKEEKIPYRTILSNAASELVVDVPWVIEHTTATEYVILASDTWREITGHGLTAPVTDVLVSITGVVYFCQGDAVKIRRHREYNNAGAWMESTAAEWAAEATATSYGTFIVYKPQAGKIVIAKNSDTAGLSVCTTEVMSNASVPPWATDLTWAAAVVIGDKYERINGLEIYPDDSGNEAVRVYKEGIPWVLPGTGTPYPVNLREMALTRNTNNGRAHTVHNVYEYFSLGNGVTRYYGGNFEEVGPNQGEGLPTERQGPVVALLGYPGKVFEIVDAGSTGYSSLIMRDGAGDHEHYRAPKGQRLTAVGFQPIPGTTLDRMWLYQGNDSIWLPFPSDTTNELDDPNYLFTHEASLVLSRYHAGMFDIQKLARIIKLQSENLSKGVAWIEMDYRLNENTSWASIDDLFVSSPTQQIDLIDQYGIAGKRIQLRLRSYTTNASITPILLAIIVEAVLRSSIKNAYPLTFRLMDNEPNLSGARGSEPSDFDPMEKLLTLQEWADDRSDSMLLMQSTSRLYHNRMVFLNSIQPTQKFIKPDPDKEEGVEVFVCTSSAQEA